MRVSTPEAKKKSRRALLAGLLTVTLGLPLILAAILVITAVVGCDTQWGRARLVAERLVLQDLWGPQDSGDPILYGCIHHSGFRFHVLRVGPLQWWVEVAPVEYPTGLRR